MPEKKNSYRKDTQEVRSKCTRGRPCQSVVKKTLHKRVSGELSST